MNEAESDRGMFMEIEAWEQPTKKNNAVYLELQQGYLKLVLIDDDGDTEDEDGDLAVPLS